MTPEQVREMPNRDCILLIEGMKPIYDRKNRPFATSIWKEAEAAAGVNGYTHPVRVIHDKDKDVYKTVECEKKIRMIDKDEEAFYRNAAKTDKNIHFFNLDNDVFLYLNLDDQPIPTMEELQEIVCNSKKNDVSSINEPADVKRKMKARTSNKEDVEIKDSKSRDNWNLQGTVLECIHKYAEYLTHEEMDIILQCMQIGLSERQIKHIMKLSDPENMKKYQKIYSLCKK